MLSSTSDRAKLFAKNFSKDLDLDDSGITLLVFYSRTNLKLYPISVTSKMGLMMICGWTTLTSQCPLENDHKRQQILFFSFFSMWVFFHKHSRFTGQQGKGEGIYLTPLYHFHPLHRHLDISRAITAESSLLHIAGSRTRTGNLWLPSPSR